MSARRKALVAAAAFAMGGLVASIPVFVDRSGSPERAPAARYEWLARLPGSKAPAPEPRTEIGAAPDGQKLLATRTGKEELCMRFGSSGRACESVDTTKQIQLVARVRGSDEDVLWGILADDVAAIRVRHEDGSATDRDARRGYGVLEPRGNDVISIAALDRDGREVGRVAGNTFVVIACSLTSCMSVDAS